MLLRIFFIIFMQLIPLTWTHSRTDYAGKICNSIEIRKLEDFDKLRRCNIVVGHVRIINVQMTAAFALASETAVEEITDYLLVYRVEGVASLRSIFPNLVLIRGEQLLFDQYSLAVYENRNLEDLGLVSLLRIQKGNIRLEGNPLLCYTDTVNWVYLLGNTTQQLYSYNHNKSPNHCPRCDSTHLDYKKMTTMQIEDILNRHCWFFEQYQEKPPYYKDYEKCPDSGCTSAYGGCNIKGICCNRNCLKGCSGNDCTLCSNLQQAGKCVDSCTSPMYYQYRNRECLPESDCRERGWIPHAGYCLEKCPENYLQRKYEDQQLGCELICKGTYVIHHAEDLKNLKDCESIQGSLIIQLTDVKAKIIDHFERQLINIKEITGYVKITGSHALLSLSFLRNLNTIRGDDLIENKYALYVVNNHHLEHIWIANQKVAILKGTVYFHLNPRLCYEKIMQLAPSLKSVQEISIADASQNSNGERVVCGEGIRLLKPIVEDLNSTAARIKLEPWAVDDKEVLLGYMHHYKEAPHKNITMYDGRHGCGHDNWQMDLTISQNIRHIISGLKPYTQYAYFVKTLTKTDYHVQIDAYSTIDYFTTLPTKPGPVAKIYAHPLSTSEIEVHWWPPRRPNGVIEKYIMTYEKINNSSPNATVRNYFQYARPTVSTDTCQCPHLKPELSGPKPEDENYFNKDQITYDEALPNLIYVARPLADRSKDSQEEKTDRNKDSKEEKTSETEVVRTKKIRRSAVIDNSPKQAQVSKDSKANEADSKTTEKPKNAAPLADGEGDLNDSTYRKYYEYRQNLERKALASQDTGTSNFHIVQPLPICSFTNPSVQFQLENSCKASEHFTGTIIPGYMHSFVVDGLEVESSYRISLRACVEGLENGCGPVVTTTSKTVSKRLDEILSNMGLDD